MMNGPPPASIEILPQDLYDYIIDTVACDHPRSLSKCSRVSRGFRARAQTYLYRTVTVYLGPKPSTQHYTGYFYIPVSDLIACADYLLVLIRRLSIHTTCSGSQLATVSEALLERTWPQMFVHALSLTGEAPSEGSCHFSLMLLACHEIARQSLRRLDLLRWERAPLTYIVDLIAGFASLEHLILEVNVPGSSTSLKMPRPGGHLSTLTLQLSFSVPLWTGIYLNTLLSNGWSIDMIFLETVARDPELAALDEQTQKAKIRSLRVTSDHMPVLFRLSPRRSLSGFSETAAFKVFETVPLLTLLEFHQNRSRPAKCDLAAGLARFLYHCRTKVAGRSLPRYFVLSLTVLQHSELLGCCASQSWRYLHDEMSLAESEMQLLVIFAIPLSTVMSRTAAQVEAERWRDIEEAMRGRGMDSSVVSIVDLNRWPDGRLDAGKVQRVIEGTADLRTLADV